MIGVGCVMEHTPTGKILCLLRSGANFQKGEWELLYGRLDQHEDLFEALRREVKEEVDLEEFEISRLLRVWHFYRGEETAEKEIHGFTFHCKTKDQNIKISTEHSEFRWVEPKEALKLLKIDGIREDVRFFLEQKESRKVAFSGTSNKIGAVLPDQ